MLLAIDTSNKNSGIALIDKETTIVELIEWNTTYNHTPDLLPNIHKILSNSKLTFEDLQGISSNIGPGQFSGLRVGLTTAKTISWSYNLPLVSSTSLEIEAYNHRVSKSIICPVIILNKLQIAWSMYNFHHDTMNELYETHIDNIDKFSNNIESIIDQSKFNDKDVIICGESIDGVISSSINNKYKVIDSSSTERIINLATIGLNKLNNNEIADATVIEPFYLKPPTITKPKK